jgi:large subunit ribosomal protein L17
MRHRKRTIKLGRTTAHRESLLSNQVCSLITAKRIKTTLPKARATRSLAEKMVTLGKTGSLAAQRRAIATLKDTTAVSELFKAIAPAFQDRQGGYTRIMKLGKRSSDSAEMALLEWVNYVAPAPRKKADSAKTKSGKPAAGEDKKD